MEDDKKNITVPTHNEQFRHGSDLEGSSRNHIFTKNMVSRRNQLQYTQQKLSDLTGIKLRTIQNYEKGQQPKGYNAVAIAEALKCSLDWLLIGKGPEPPGPGEDYKAGENEIDLERGPVDIDLLSTIIKGVEKYLYERNLELQAEKKARAISLLYELFMDKEKKVTGKIINSYMRLVV